MNVKSLIENAVSEKKLLASAAENIFLILSGAKGDLTLRSITELAEGGHWNELNDRFFKKLAFGTGGLRGRTIGRVITQAEQGDGGVNGRPQFPAVGTATMNYFNVSRAIRGLVTYTKKHVGTSRKPKIVLAHDTRHFSRDFAEFCAKVCVEMGCDVWLAEGARSTPQLSFTIRDLNADAGVVLTASHNPSHDNGFKAYFNDGGQIVEPHATGIITEVNQLESESYEPLTESEHGTLHTLGKEADRLYMNRLQSILMQPKLLEKTKAKVVYTNLHGTGAP